MFDIQKKVEDIVESYKGYIPSQFLDKPKALATIELIIKVALADAIFDQIAIAFAMDEASGKTLTMIAENFGLSRNLPTSAIVPFFQNPSYNDMSYNDPNFVPPPPPPPDMSLGTTPEFIGFTNYYDSTNYDSIFRRYSSTDSVTTSVPDSILKQVIVFKILSEKCKGSLESIVSLLQASGLSKQVVLIDGGNRTITYRVRTTDSLLADILFNLNYFPRPIGIESNIVKVNNPFGVFHFLSYGGSVLGFCFNAYGEPLNNRSWLQYSEINNFN